MRLIRQIFQLSTILLLSGCASSNAKYYTQAVQSWQGTPMQSLIKAWGMPDSKLTNPQGNNILVYKNQTYSAYNTTTSPAIGVNFTDTGRPVITTTPSTNNSITRGAMTLICVTLFEVNHKGVIIDASVQGNGCYSNKGFAESLAKPGTVIS